MKLTQKLLGFLNSVFDKDPKPFLALRLQYAGAMSWSIADEVLTTVVVGGPGHALSVDLSQHTVGSLVSYLAGQAGYTVAFADASRAGLSARVLLDGGADQAASNGDRLYGYTSLLWAYMESVASELVVAESLVAAAPRQINVLDGQGMWLDEIGSYYGVPRTNGELDPQYGPRIIAEALRPRSNNIAIENAIGVYTGRTAQVVDVTVYGGAVPLYNGASLYNSAKVHNGGSSPLYGLFDVNYAYDLLGDDDPTAFAQTVRGIIERLRAAGTHLRALALQTSAMTDAFTAPTDSSTLAVAATLADTQAPPTETVSTIATVLGALLDTLTAPTDATDDVVESLLYRYGGQRSYNSAVPYAGYEVRDETLDGSTVNSMTAMDWFSLDFIGNSYRRGLFYSTSLSSFPGFAFSGGVQASGGVATGATAQGVVVQYPARPNLILQSQNFANAAWAVAGGGAKVAASGVLDPAGGTNAYEISFTTGGTFSGASAVYQNVTLTSGVIYTGSVWVRTKDGSTSSARIGVYNNTADPGSPDQLVDGTWRRITYTSPGAGGGTGNLSIRPNAAGTTPHLLVWGAQLEPGPIAYHYKPTTTAVVWSCDPRIVPASRTNLARYSQDMTNLAAWSMSHSGGGVAPATTANYATAPDGTLTASRLVVQTDGLVGSLSYLFQGTTYSGPVTYSLWVKSNTGASYSMWFRLGAQTSTITVTNAWQRFTITDPAASGSNFLIGIRDNTYPSFADVLVWGAQVEAGSAPSAYIPTGSLAVTVFDQAVVRTNLLLQSADLTSASWAANAGLLSRTSGFTAPDNSSTAVKVVPDTTTGQHRLGQTLTGTAAVYTASIYAKASGYNWLVINMFDGTSANLASFNLATGAIGTLGAGNTATITPAANGFYRITVSRAMLASASTQALFYPSSADNTISMTGDGVSGAILWGPQFEASTLASAYIPTTAGAVSVVDQPTVATTGSGFLYEESRSNTLLQSQTFDNAAWSKTNAAITADQTIAPDATQTADLLTATATSQPRVEQNPGLAASTTYAVSVYVKAGTATHAGFGFFDGAANHYISYNTQAGTYDGVFGTVFSNISVTAGLNGWVRIAAKLVTPASIAGSSGLKLIISDTTISVSSPTSTSGVTASLWGAQLEVGATVSSYIPTTTSAVTRAADAATINGITLPNGAATWTLFGQAYLPNYSSAVYEGIAGVDDGPAATNQITMFASAGGRARVQMASAGASTYDSSNGLPLVPTPANVKVAASYSGGKVTAEAFGTSLAAVTATAPAGTSRLVLGLLNGVSQPTNGFIQKVALLPAVVTGLTV